MKICDRCKTNKNIESFNRICFSEIYFDLCKKCKKVIIKRIEDYLEERKKRDIEFEKHILDK